MRRSTYVALLRSAQLVARTDWRQTTDPWCRRAAESVYRHLTDELAAAMVPRPSQRRLLIFFKGATAWEAQVGRLYVTVTRAAYRRPGQNPVRIGWDRS